jgi:hypothetical protein
MTMARGVTELDRLIEQGLSLYGEGDLDGALLLWERVLVMDPENAQANSYVDYVRMNYELLTSDGNTEHSGPFGIDDDEPEYQIEILPGEDVEPAAPAPLYMDARDEGWVIGDEARRAALRVTDELSLELEADEPPLGGDAGVFESAKTGESVSFDDNTREYPGGAGRPATALLGDGRATTESTEFVPEVTPPFGSPEDFQTPPGFGSQVTDIRRRDFGFVQPADAAARATPPELKMTIRTPSQAIPLSSPALELPPAPGPGRQRAATADSESDDEATVALSPNNAPTLDLESPAGGADPGSAYDSLDLDLSPASDPPVEVDLAGRAETRPAARASKPAPHDTAEDPMDLLATVPVPPRASTTTTRPLPGKTRMPAGESQSPPEPAPRPQPPDPRPDLGGSAPTQEMPYTIQLDPLLAIHPDPQRPPALTRDFSEKPAGARAGRSMPIPADDPFEKPTTPRTPRPIPPTDDPMIAAPTRELGLRGGRRPATEDEPTSEVDVHKIRETARGNGKPELPGMDPIDARSAEILEEIDSHAPAGETREDRTRRRITALLERATEWGHSSDLERSVAAVDLALSEDPNSALAQKLIHRNRETIMNAFQGFLGDLQRTPVLARPLHELGSAPISPRAAFLLSRVDGTLSLDEILDVSGMPRLEAYRYLCQLLLRGILR